MSFGNSQIISSQGSSVQPTPPQPIPNAPQSKTAGAVALVNGALTFLSYAVPNDGRAHFVLVSVIENITVTQVGGGINANITSDGNAFSPSLLAGGQGVGALRTTGVFLCDPGTTLTVQQTAAQTSGSATATIHILDLGGV